MFLMITFLRGIKMHLAVNGLNFSSFKNSFDELSQGYLKFGWSCKFIIGEKKEIIFTACLLLLEEVNCLIFYLELYFTMLSELCQIAVSINISEIWFQSRAVGHIYKQGFPTRTERLW